jgi:phosphatidyl-myo-inositol alpha-mannosyltransferase
VHRLANALVSRGHAVTCFSFSPRPADAAYGHVGLVRRARAKALKKFEPAVAFAAQKTKGYDILHYHGDDFLAPRSPRRVRTFYGSALQEALHAKTAGRFIYQALFYVFELVSTARGGEKVGISRATGRSIPFVNKSIPCGVPTERYFPLGAKTEAPSLLFVGDLDSRKRGRFMLRVFIEQVQPRYPQCQLTVVGPQSCGGPGIRWLGTIAEDALVVEFRKAWVYCMASSYEGFGVPAIEAMACGCAVVAVENAGIREIVMHKHNGFLADDATFSRSIHPVLGDAALRRGLEKEGLAAVRAKYDMQVVASQYEQVYRRVLERSGQD